ncbi:magnesium transporter CorA family protein [Oceaniglobus trochenteri]|uniref:magnesium transporter CorA family protein n=1 Tax=Oceaniglobus trochenteri TaxID=2763260 RepID=UPI001D000BBF|nr:magnesium transporter CorA family protein [Oceaniglobus trochenteri]
MIRAFAPDGPLLRQSETLADALWLDLFEPTAPEIEAVEQTCGFALPTLDDMVEIEISSRLYVEGKAAFMTALIPSRTDTDDLLMKPVTFILSAGRLITIRYHDPRVFGAAAARFERGDLDIVDAEGALLHLLDGVVDRLADILERAGHDVDAVSRQVFAPKGTAPSPDYKTTLETIGRKGDLTSNLRDSLMTLSRLATFLEPRLQGPGPARHEALRTLGQDIRSLLDHCGFISQKVTFLLDATLGLISIEQNGIIKIFSVAAVMFLPPTLVASVYGMNFVNMPELALPYGYPMALGLMVVSAVVPYLFFKRRGWL